MFLLELWVVVNSPFTEPHVTVSPYRPHTAVAGELTDSLTVVPSCSTILASQHSSSSWSTIGMMTWVPLDTMGSGPATQVIVESCYRNTVTKVSGTRDWCIKGDICFVVIFPFPSVCYKGSCACKRSLKLKKKSVPKGAPWNASSVAPPLIP